MSKELTVMSWNLLDGINSLEVQNEILSTEPDIAVLPEAAREQDGIEASTIRRFNNAGYDLYERPYADDDDRKDRHRLAIVVKPEHVVGVDAVRISGRTALLARLVGGVDLAALHLDDRTEKNRLRQAEQAIAQLGKTALAIGDTNALYGDTFQSRLLRMSAPFANLLPSIEPGIQNPPKVRRLGSLSQRMTAFAIGTTMQAFTEAEFRDASEDGAATMIKGPIALQLDRVMYRGDFSVVKPTQVDDAGGLSDHKRIQARLACYPQLRART